MLIKITILQFMCSVSLYFRRGAKKKKTWKERQRELDRDLDSNIAGIGLLATGSRGRDRLGKARGQIKRKRGKTRMGVGESRTQFQGIFPWRTGL